MPSSRGNGSQDRVPSRTPSGQRGVSFSSIKMRNM